MCPVDQIRPVKKKFYDKNSKYVFLNKRHKKTK